MHSYQVLKVGHNNKGARIWVRGDHCAKSGFVPGAQFSQDIQPRKVVLRLRPDGDRAVVKGEKNGKEFPIIDLNNKQIEKSFEGFEQVKVIMGDGFIEIVPLDADLREMERRVRLETKLVNGEPLVVGSTSHGFGGLSLAVHKGFKKAGIVSELAFANDIREDVLDQAQKKNPAWSERTTYVNAPMQELVFDRTYRQQLPQLDVLEAGLSCIAASNAGKVKNGLNHPEQHPQVGHLVVSFLAMVAMFNPSIIVFENVVPYASSASMSIIRNQLGEWGYNLHETVLAGEDFNVMEHRKRLSMVAITKGIDYSLESVKYPEKIQRKLAEILDPVPLDDPSWSKMEGLKAKEERDAANNKSFAMQIFTGDEDHIKTLTAGLARNRSTDPKIQHPTNPELLRVPTVNEHARAKGFDPDMVEGLSKTTAHEMLGQSILLDTFVALIESVGNCLVEHTKKLLQAATELKVVRAEPIQQDMFALAA